MKPVKCEVSAVSRERSMRAQQRSVAEPLNEAVNAGHPEFVLLHRHKFFAKSSKAALDTG
jgi:hypothetical protein